MSEGGRGNAKSSYSLVSGEVSLDGGDRRRFLERAELATVWLRLLLR